MEINEGQFDPDYTKTILDMHLRMMDWRKANPTKEVLIHFRDTLGGQKVLIVAPIRPALNMGLITVNENGYEMLRVMCEPQKDEPTVMMVRKAIELEIT